MVNFSDEAYIDQDFTSSIPKLRDGLGHIDSKGGTALYDAIMASADYLTKNAKRSKQVRGEQRSGRGGGLPAGRSRIPVF